MSEKHSNKGRGTVRTMSTDTKFTPGPWDDASNYPYVDSVRIFAGTHYIATVGHSDDVRAITLANARLIAAAPDLYAALKLFNLTEESIVSGTAKTITLTIPFEFIAKAAAAVAKAEGR